MTLRELGISYLKSWKGRILLAATLLAAIIFVCFFADTLARNTYIPKKGESVIHSFQSEYNPAEEQANQFQLSKTYASLSANQEAWTSSEASLTDGVFCVSSEHSEYLVYQIDSANILEQGKTFRDFNHIWIGSENDAFYAVLNISGKEIDLTDYYILVQDETGVYGSRAILNFYEAESVNLTNAIVMGTVLAPNANIICNNTSVSGQLLGKEKTGETSFYKDLRFTGYRNIMNHLNVISLKNDVVRIAAIEYLINNDPDYRYEDYTISSSVRTRDVSAVRKLNINAQEVIFDSLEEDLALFPNLEEISINGGDLPSFTLEKSPDIKSLSITGTNLALLDISAAPGLERLILDNNPLMTVLDFTNNPGIKILSYAGTPLGWMDYSSLPELYYLDCSNSNVRDYLTISGETLPNIRMLDVSGNKNIQTFYIQTFPLLESVNCSGCSILELDFSSSEKLTYFKGSYNRLKNINFQGAINLQYIEAYGGSVESLDLRGLQPQKVYCTVKMITDEGEVYPSGFEPEPTPAEEQPTIVGEATE
jgi:ORF MSV257 leucine rich repeat gene family protein, similar to amsacta moorei entomopoxvirus Q3 ORF SW:P28854